MSLPAVRASRMKGTAKSLNLYPTPPWATRALCDFVLGRHLGLRLGHKVAWDPCCGKGHMALPLGEHFLFVHASDVHDWGFGNRRDLDFGFAQAEDCPQDPDWIIANPPFTLADRFAIRGVELARCGVAILVRLQWLEGAARYETFYRPGAPYRPTLVAVFSERVSMIEGVWDPEANLASAYAWIVWDKANTRIRDLPTIPTLILPPTMQRTYSRPQDEALAVRGEARRRRDAAKAEAP